MSAIRLWSSLFFVVLLSACSSQQPKRDAMSELFDGQTLAGWTVSGDSQWQVENGEIVASGVGDGFLLSERKFQDFHLTLEFWVDADTNSGIFFRCSNPENIHPETCYEANIWDEHPQQVARTGSIVYKAMPPLKRVETVGRWNTYKIAAEGKRVLVEVNGQMTAFLYDAQIKKGFIALQHWRNGTVKFRNIRIREL
jgi:hypothetical protein